MVQKRLSLKRFMRDPHGYVASLTQADLLRLLKRLDHEYYVNDIQKVPDAVYDVAKDAFAERYPKHKYNLQVAAPSKSEYDVELPYPMGSLLKVKPESDAFYKFVDKYVGPWCLSDKLDGISMEIIYENGKPVAAYTRGEDGIIGKDISRHIKSLRIPKRISYKGHLAVRAEAIVPEKVFFKYLHLDVGGEYKTARNAVGGMINRDESIEHFKKVRILAFRILGGALANKRVSLQFKKLEALGFDVPKYRAVKSVTSEQLSRYYASRSKNSPYEIDGIVVEHNVVNPLVSGRPPYAKAFKENLLVDMVDVVLQGIEWQDTRTGILSPVGIIKPTLIGGVTVERVSLHNLYTVQHGYRYKDRKLGLPLRPIGRGAKVRMVRSGKVIPHMVEVLKAARRPALPKVAFEQKGRHAYLTERTDAAEIRAITHFFSTIKVEGLKAGTARKLYDDGYVDVVSIVKMKPVHWRNSSVGESAAMKLPSEIKRKLAAADVVQLAHASNIFMGVGTTRFEAVFDAYPDIIQQASRSKTTTAIKAKVESLPNFGSVMSKKIADNIKEFATFLKALGIKPKAQEKVAVKGNALDGHTIAFTGVRDEELKNWIISQGGKVAGSFTKAVSILVVKDANFSSSSVDKAEDRGIPIVPKDKLKDFVKRL